MDSGTSNMIFRYGATCGLLSAAQTLTDSAEATSDEGSKILLLHYARVLENSVRKHAASKENIFVASPK